MSVSKELQRLYALYEDQHGVTRANARAAVLATPRGAELAAQLPPKPAAPTIYDRISQCHARLWAKHAPGKTPEPLEVMSTQGQTVRVSIVRGLPLSVFGCALQGYPPLILIADGLDAAMFRHVLAHEIGHLIFERMDRESEATGPREERADKFAAELLALLDGHSQA